MRRTLLFLCPHNAAKSIMAAAYCQEVARQQGLDVRITSAGTEPDATVLPSVTALLHTEGIDVAHYTPRHVTPDELDMADCVISLGCDVTALASPTTQVVYWNDVPPPSTELARARDVIYAHVEQLVCALQAAACEEG